MTDSIFAGSLSLTDDIPEVPSPEPDSVSLRGRFQVPMPPLQQKPRETWHGTPQFKPVQEYANPAAERVRAEAARLGIDYDSEVVRVLHQMKGGGYGGFTPNPYNSKPGPDPLRNVSQMDWAKAEGIYGEQLKRFYGIS